MEGRRFGPRNGSRGVAAIELALLMVPLLFIVFGVTEYGRAIYTYNTLVKSTRDAARYLTAPDPNSNNPIRDAENLAVFGNRAGTGPPLAPDLTTAMVSICMPGTCPGYATVPTAAGNNVNLLSVTISGYEYTSIITYVAPTTMDFSDISVTMLANL